MSSGEKTKSKSVSLAPDLWERVEAKAEAKFGGNRSLYARQLFVADLAGEEPLMIKDGSILQQLAEEFHPTIADEVVDATGGRNQARILARFFEALAEAARNPDFNPAEPFHLYNSREQLLEQVTGTAPGITLMKNLLSYMQAEAPTWLAAEGGAPSSPISDAAAEAARLKAAQRSGPAKSRQPRSGPSDPEKKS